MALHRNSVGKQSTTGQQDSADQNGRLQQAWQKLASGAQSIVDSYQQAAQALGVSTTGLNGNRNDTGEQARIDSARQLAQQEIEITRKKVAEQEKLERQLTQAVLAYNEKIARSFASTVAQSLTQSYVLLMQYLGSLFTSAPISMKEFLADFLKIVGTAMVALGTALLFASKAWLSFFSGNWFGAIAASGALIAAGGVMIALSSALSRSGSGSRGSGSSISNPVYTAPSYGVDTYRSSASSMSQSSGSESGSVVHLTLNYAPTVGRRSDGPVLARAVLDSLERYGSTVASTPAKVIGV